MDNPITILADFDNLLFSGVPRMVLGRKLNDRLPVPCTCALCPVPYMADTIQSRSHFGSFPVCALLSSSSLADAMTSAAGNNLATTSASQPSASSCSGGARGSDAGDPQPAINRSNLNPIVTEVLEFGRIPQRVKRPTTKEERKENNLADRLNKKRKSLHDLDNRQLE